MAVFVFGAGATRGASWVDATRDPCIPPLDADFFTQLQRVPDAKHQQTISDVMADVVGLFGTNFNATMETVFSTVEHTLRMIAVTGENRAWKKDDLVAIRERLLKAIAAVFEASLTRNTSSGSSHSPEVCDYHDRFVEEVLAPRDTIVSFNYDCVLDYALKRHGSGKWCPRYGYGFNLGARGRNLTGDEHWNPAVPASKEATVHCYKLHGSLHFQVTKALEERSTIKLKSRPYATFSGRLSRFTIIPPEWHKAYDRGFFSKLWAGAAGALRSATNLVVVGYSLPLTDLHANALFRTSSKQKLRSLVVVNPDRDARHRIRAVLSSVLDERTRVLSFDYLPEFLALDRAVWAL